MNADKKAPPLEKGRPGGVGELAVNFWIGLATQ